MNSENLNQGERTVNSLGAKKKKPPIEKPTRLPARATELAPTRVGSASSLFEAPTVTFQSIEVDGDRVIVTLRPEDYTLIQEQVATQIESTINEKEVLHSIHTNFSQEALGAYVESVSTGSSEEIPEISEVQENEDLIFTLEDLSEAESLSEVGVSALHPIIEKHFHDPRLWEVLENKGASKLDCEILKANHQLLSAELIHSTLIIGGIKERYFDHHLEKERTLIIYNGAELGKGQMGSVNHVLYAYDDDLKLINALMKSALDSKDAAISFQHELQIAQHLKLIIEANLDDPRIRNVLYPIYIGSNFTLMPRIRDQEDNSLNLSDYMEKLKIEKPEGLVKSFAKNLAGAYRGLTFLSENGMINTDLKQGNILVGKYGGTIIDWGGIMKTAAVSDGKSPIFSNATYFNTWLAVNESLNQLPPGTTHKYALSRFIERYFFLAEKVKEGNFDSYTDLASNPRLQLQLPRILLDEDNLNAGEVLLKVLYLKVRQSHLHPYRFHQNDPQQGIDPDYISEGEIIAMLEEVSQLNV